MLWLSAATVATLMLVVCPAFADSPTTVINAVGNAGNTSGQAAVGTSGNVNQNTNQNSLGTTSSTAVNIGGINLSVPAGTGAGAVGAAGESGEGYVGYSGSTTFASPSVTFGNSKITNVNLPGIPGIPGAPGNFSQPYKPDVFINGAGPVRPARMTYDQARDCRGGYGYKDSYVGANREKAKEITLVYAAWDKIDVTNDISNYVGISSVEGADKPWLPAVCEAAYHAMEKGANYGVVEFIIRPKNTMKGFGVGSSGGGSIVPSVATAASPYGLAASLGFGLGWSSQRVEGEVMIQLTGLRVTPPAAAKPQVPAATAPAAQPVAAPAPAAVAPAKPEDGRIIIPNGKQPLKLPAPAAPNPDAQPQSDQGQPPPQPEPAQLLNVPGQPLSSGAPQPNGAGPRPGNPAQAAADPGAPLNVPGQPLSSSAQPASAPAPQPSGSAPQPLSVPGQPVSSSAQPVSDPGQPLSVPGQPTSFSGQSQSAPAPQPVSFQPQTGSGQPISKLNPAGDIRGPR